MTRAEIEEQVRQVHGNLSRRESQGVVGKVFNLIKQSLEHGESVQISGFGQFEVRHNAARKGRNIKTGQTVPIAPRQGVVFRPSQALKNLMQHG